MGAHVVQLGASLLLQYDGGMGWEDAAALVKLPCIVSPFPPRKRAAMKPFSNTCSLVEPPVVVQATAIFILHLKRHHI